METPKSRKTSQISLKSFYALMRWFFRRVDIEVYGKSVIETLFSRFSVTGRDVAGHVTSSFQAKMARYVWAGEETELFLKF